MQDFEWAKINLSIFAKQITKRTVNLTYKIALYDYHLLQIDIQPKIVLSRISYNFIESGSIFCEDFSQRNLIWILHWSPRMFWHIFQIFMTWLWINKFSLFCFLHPNFIILMAWNMKNEMSVLSLDVQNVKAKKKLSKCKKTFLKFKSY